MKHVSVISSTTDFFFVNIELLLIMVRQSIANIFLGTEYEYEYIRNFLFHTNTNLNIFQDHIFDRIQTGSNQANFLHRHIFMSGIHYV